jgi:hypothetical protein
MFGRTAAHTAAVLRAERIVTAQPAPGADPVDRRGRRRSVMPMERASEGSFQLMDLSDRPLGYARNRAAVHAHHWCAVRKQLCEWANCPGVANSAKR